MPRSEVNPILSVPNLKLLKTYFDSGELFHEVRSTLKVKCSQCGASGRRKLRLKEVFNRKIQHECIGKKRSYLVFKQRKYHCQKCGRYFREEIPCVLRYQRSTEHVRFMIAKDHHDGLTKAEVSNRYAVSEKKVDRQYEHLQSRHLKEISSRVCPRVMGIDEHFLNKKVGYVTTFVNLKTHKVFDLAAGRSEQALKSFLETLKGRDRVRVVVMDLSSTYRSIVEKYFPRAMIVSDRFHVIRLINHQLLGLWKKLDPQGRSNRGLLSLVRRHSFKLSSDQAIRLASYFQRVPALGPLYNEFKALINLLLAKHQTARRVRKNYIPKLFRHLENLENCPFEETTRLAHTLRHWLEPNARMWRFTKTNSITEGIHNKMERIQRIAYGFHSFKNYRIRVLAHCA